MRSSVPLFKDFPSVKSALGWLLPPAPIMTDRELLTRARLTGLIQLQSRGRWAADGKKVARLAKHALRRLPGDAEKLGDLLHGLGEIGARSHAALIEPLIGYLHRRRNHLRLGKLLNRVFIHEAKKRPPVKSDVVATAQWLSHAKLEWNTFDQALSRIEHGHGLIGDSRFGLRFATRIILALDPRVIDDWIDSHPNTLSLATIWSAALSMVFPFDQRAQIEPLLRSRNSAIRCLGAASLICPLEFTGPPLGFPDCRKALVVGGIDPTDATWMMGMRIKRAIHQRYRLAHEQEQIAPRLRYVEKNPQAAMGGARNAEAELRNLRTRLDRNAERHSKLLPELEQMLEDMTTDWPRDGLSDEQMKSLDNIFVDTAEFRFRLAEKLPHQANRGWLLKRNATRLKQFLETEVPGRTPATDHFLPHEPQFRALMEWTARSLVLLYDADQRGVGKRTSDLVKAIATAADDLVAQPFIDVRKPGTWQSVMTRAACADRFALAVVASVAEDKRQTVLGLNDLALEHTFMVLSTKHIPAQSLQTLFWLTLQAVHGMRFLTKPDELREKWALAKLLPDFARATALWASPDLVSKHKVLACELFRRVGCLPLWRAGRDLQMSQMLCLLDFSVSSCATTGDTALVACITSLWGNAYKDWLAITDQWSSAAEMLVGAITSKGQDRERLLADPTFASSYCRQIIEAQEP